MRRTLTLAASMMLLAACGRDGSDEQRKGREIEQVRNGETFGFGSIEKVSGTVYFTLPIIAAREKQSVASYSKGYDPEDVRNRLIVDSVSGEGRKILPNEAFQISDWIELGELSSDDPGQASHNAYPTMKDRPVEHYLAVVRRPAKKAEAPPTFDILAGAFASKHQRWIAQGISNFKGAWLLKDGKIATITASGDRQFYRVYDPQTLALLLDKELRL